MATSAQSFFQISQQYVVQCKRCNEPIYWQQGRRSGRMYPTDVLVQNGVPVSSRTNFHRCDQANIDKINRQRAEANGQQSFTQKKLDMSGVNKLFDKAVASGLKWPKIRLQTKSGQTVALGRAGAQSRHPGNIMVTDGEKFGHNKYFGRVDQTGTYYDGRDNQPEVVSLLEQLGADPATVAAGYGRLTGNCCFCMRPLDDPRSVSVGYGPVCADHFGLPWGTVAIQPPTTPQPGRANLTGSGTDSSYVANQSVGPWIKSEMYWSAEVSSLSGQPKCPACDGPLPALEPRREAEEVVSYDGVCACGAKLVIFND